MKIMSQLTQVPWMGGHGYAGLARTDRKRIVNVWIPPSETKNPYAKWFCHGHSLKTYDVNHGGYSVFSGIDVQKVLDDEYLQIGSDSNQQKVRPGDVVAWWGPVNQGQWMCSVSDKRIVRGQHLFNVSHSAIVTSVFYKGETTRISEVSTKNGFENAPAIMLIEDVCKKYDTDVFSVHRKSPIYLAPSEGDVEPFSLKPQVIETPLAEDVSSEASSGEK